MTLLDKTVSIGPAKPRQEYDSPESGDARPGTNYAPSWMPVIGDKLFGFRLTAELGRGAFAFVFLAEQQDLAGRPVVVKVSRIEGDEPNTLAQLQHTHIVPIHSVHENESLGLRAVCMPYFGGATLTKVLETLWSRPTPPTRGADFVAALEQASARTEAGGAQPTRGQFDPKVLDGLRSLSYVQSCVWIAARLAEALHHAHQRGVIHCDVKPSNVLIGSDGTPMLLDFNVSHASHAESTRGLVGGTWAYMAPERRDAMVILRNTRGVPGETVVVPTNACCDIYALGVVLYEMLSGDSLERPGNLISFPLSPRGKNPAVPWSLESICRKCLTPNPAQRYQRADELALDLQRFLNDEPLRFAPEPSVAERIGKWFRRHPRVRSTGSVGVLAAILLTVMTLSLMSHRRHLDRTQEALEQAHAEDCRRAYEQGAMQALCLVNTQSEEAAHRQQGHALCERTLAIYGVLEREDWRNHPAWRRLDPESRRRLAEDTRELLMLLSWSKVRGQPGDTSAVADALALLERAENIDGLTPSRALWEERAKFLELQNDAGGARAARTQAGSIPSETARDFYMLATMHARRGEYAVAVAHLDRALQLNPRHYWALVQRGICHQELGHSTLAAGDFGACVGLWPDFAFGYFNRGYILEKSGHHAEAIADYTAAIEREPHFVLAHVNRGMARLERMEHAGALADLRRAHALGRDDASIHFGIGMALEGLKQHADADVSFTIAWKKSAAEPKELQLRHHWVYGFALADRAPHKSAEAFDAVLRSDSRHPQALYGKAVLLINQKQEAEALKLLDQIVPLAPGFLAPRRSRAVLHARRGDFTQAARDVNACLEQHAEHGPNLYTAACVAALAAEKASEPAAAQRAAAQALTFLDKALEFTYARHYFADDPDLNGIRHEPRFAARLNQTTSEPRP